MSTLPVVALALAGSLSGPPPPPTGQWSWPVGGGDRPALLAPFAAPEEQWGAGHRGIDLATTKGAPVTAVADGVVTHRGVIAGRGTVSIRHASGVRSTYEPVVSDLSVGEQVRRGQVVGRVGSGATHCDPSTCLHLGAKREATYVDPMPFFGTRRVILLPVP